LHDLACDISSHNLVVATIASVLYDKDAQNLGGRTERSVAWG
jgi:hypothetical protein